MRLGRVHLADVVARARASIARLAVRPHGPDLGNVVGRARGTPSRIDPAEAAAYEEATRQAFRAGTRREPPRPPALVPPAGSAASVSDTARAVASLSELAAPARDSTVKREWEPLTTAVPTRRPRRQTGEAGPAPTAGPASSASRAKRTAASGSTPTALPAAPTPEPTPASANPEPPARRLSRQAGETAPDFLLRAPTGVAPIVDDFFDGLVRRVEGDR